MKLTHTKRNTQPLYLVVLLSSLLSFSSSAFNDEQPLVSEQSKDERYFEQCLLDAIKSESKSSTIEQIERLCANKIVVEVLEKKSGKKIELGALANRIMSEKRTAFNPYVITPHRMNYILPASVTDGINSKAYTEVPNWAQHLEDTEAKFQISIKVPLLTDSLFVEGDQVFFGFTLQSWWQIYSDEISKPFRETNYQPEFFYFAPINFHPFGGNSAIIIGAEHQSNGRSQLLSKSWNRIYFTYLYEKRSFALSLRPWYRLSESEKETPLSSEGDDNPDILDYMGHFELGMAYKHNLDYEFSIKARNNFATHNGFIELGFTFPLWGKLKGYAQVSSGYGESLIDYNYNQNRFGLGIALTDIL